MFDNISKNGALFKTIFLIAGAVLIVFCFFMNVAEQQLKAQNANIYYTFSARLHAHLDDIDSYQNIPACNDSFCKTVKSTPFLGGFMIGFCGLVLVLQLAEDVLSRTIKKLHIWIIELVSLFLAWILVLLLPILYFTTKATLWDLCWTPIIFEFFSVALLTVAFVLYYKGNSTKGAGLLSS